MKVPVSQMKSRLMCRGGTHEVHDDMFQDHACYSCGMTIVDIYYTSCLIINDYYFLSLSLFKYVLLSFKV